MARPNLPTLSWTKSSSVQTIDNPSTAVDLLAGVKTVIDQTTNWEVKTDNLSASPTPDIRYLEVGPKSSAGVLLNQRIIVAAVTSGGNIGTAATYFSGNNSTGKKSAPSTTELCVNYIPEGGSASLQGGGDPDLFSPYGSGSPVAYKRATGYTCCMHGVDGSKDYKVWAIDSKEVLGVFFNEYSNSNGKGSGFIAGPFIVGASTASDDVDTTDSNGDRIYALSAWSDFADNDDWANRGATNSPGPLNNYSNNTSFNKNSFCCFDPAAPANLLSLTRFPLGNLSNNDGIMVSGSSAIVAFDLNVHAIANVGLGQGQSAKYVGTLRQIRVTKEFPCRTKLEDGSSNQTALVYSESKTSATRTNGIAFTES